MFEVDPEKFFGDKLDEKKLKSRKKGNGNT